MKLRPRTAFSCTNPNCGRVFALKANLQEHVLYECGKKTSFKCPYCDFVRDCKSNILAHIRVNHRNRDVYVIDIFRPSVSDNKEHIAYRHTKKLRCAKFSCPNPNCESVFGWKGNLQTHLRYECGQKPRFKCPYCDYVCKSKSSVRKHVRGQHKNRAVHVIDILQSPQLGHSWYSYCPWNERPYQCLNCPNNYAKKCHLKRHVISACNDKEPRYKCPYCMYISRYASDTYKHVKRLHENQQVYAIDVLNTSNYYCSKDNLTQSNGLSMSSQKLNKWLQSIPSLSGSSAHR